MHSVSMIPKELVAASAEALILSLLSKGESYGYAIIQEVRARVLVIHAHGSATGERCRSRTRFCQSTQAIRLFRAVTSDARARGSRCPAVGDDAAASMDGHVPHAGDRFASTRARRAAAARIVRSAGTASPVPKDISSGVCPRKAECGSTRLCSWT